MWTGFEYKVPGDWSSAAFPIAASLITGSELAIKGIDYHDSQRDKALVPILRRMGAIIDENADGIYVTSKGMLSLKNAVA